MVESDWFYERTSTQRRYRNWIGHSIPQGALFWTFTGQKSLEKLMTQENFALQKKKEIWTFRIEEHFWWFVGWVSWGKNRIWKKKTTAIPAWQARTRQKNFNVIEERSESKGLRIRLIVFYTCFVENRLRSQQYTTVFGNNHSQTKLHLTGSKYCLS